MKETKEVIEKLSMLIKKISEISKDKNSVISEIAKTQESLYKILNKNNSIVLRLEELLELSKNNDGLDLIKEIITIKTNLENNENKESIKQTNDYKNDPKYKINTSILLTCHLFENIKNHFNSCEETTPNDEIFERKIGEIGETEKITLSKIAEKVLKNTGRSEQDIQFIAVGIRENDSHVITTNYHAPVVFRLEDMLLTEEHFNKINELRKEKYKNLIQCKNKGMIHAETMIASLKDSLAIKHILVIDAGGKKTENCVFCANYLSNKNFDIESHAEIVKNYSFPSKEQMEAASEWFNYLCSNEENSNHQNPYEYITKQKTKVANIESEKNNFSKELVLNKENKNNAQLAIDSVSSVSDNKNTLFGNVNYALYNHIFSSENKSEDFKQNQKIADYIIENYPKEAEKGLTKLHLQGKRLSEPGKKILNKTVLGGEKKDKVIKKAYGNYRLFLCCDNRIKKSEKSENQLSPIDPESPRSKLLVEKSNIWLKHGNNPEINIKNDWFELSR